MLARHEWEGDKPGGDLTASSMVSDFTTDMTRKIAWHTGPNPCMTVYYPVIFHHDGHVSLSVFSSWSARGWRAGRN